ncbi:cilia- and flagella-associated protein 65 isoform X3 [Heterodontus francisci]|uniref:cilia- and flagella-associated protein 65 isoform X3 n=1 Tax=Heterodontus francisci TaxID=7792 RepID=UPI00355B8917
MLTSTCPMKSIPFQEVALKTYSAWNVYNLAHTKISGRKKSKGIKSNFFGIEVMEHLEWLNWELGVESTKHLILKNVHFKTQKLKYRPPSTEFFTTMFPQPVVLGAGISYSLPITFCALEKRDYEDRIVFEMKTGTFSVQLRASLPFHDLQIPDLVCMPVCAAFDSSETTFYLHNNSQLPTRFRFEVPSPFSLVPSSGILSPWDDYKIKIVFQPQFPKVFDVIATCTFGDNEFVKYLNLEGIAKLPHLLVSAAGELSQTSGQEDTQSILNFGHVAIDTTVVKYMEIHNYSTVNTSFQIVHSQRPPPLQSEFMCEVREGTIAASRRYQVPITFTPRTVGSQSIDYFHVTRAGNSSRSVLKVIGSCKGAVVSLGHLKLNFGCVFLGETVTYATEISNTSDVPTFYQFEIDCSQSVFVINQPCGFLEGESTERLRVTFRPTHPINYYRRVACLIHHQDPLFLDLIGTCHSDQITPAILKPKHIELYRTNMARGLTFYPPDILNMMLQEGKLLLDADGALLLAPEECCKTAGKNCDEDYPNVPLLVPNIPSVIEYFDDGIHSDFTMFPPHISVSKRELNFGKCLELAQITPLPFSMMNHTKGKVTVLWISPPGSIFTVTPQTIDIPPLKTMAFHIHFVPDKLNVLYAAELECFTYYKVLRDYRLVDDSTFCPPWFLTVSVQANTFQPGHEHSIPKNVLNSPEVVLPAVNEKGTTYRTLLLKNTGNTLITFSAETQHESAIKIKPTVGFILPQAHQILTLRATPQNESLTKHTVLLHLNASEKYNQEIRLYSTVEKPLITLDGNGYLYFKPTCVGTLSERSYLIKNVTRMPLYFQWKISATNSRVLSVEPTFGIIQPNESLTQTWSFYPQEQQKYFLKPHIFVWGVKGPHCPEQGKKIRFTLRVIGVGSMGRITAEKDHIHLGDILIGSAKSDDLILVNNEACSLNFALSVKQDITGLCDPDEVAKYPMALELQYHHGTIPAKSKLCFRFTVWPVRRLRYSWKISSKILSSKVPETDENKEGEPLCCLTADGVYPMIFISDARCLGSISGISKQQLWRLFSLDTLNKYLQRDPSESELLYRVPTRHSMSRCPSVSTPVMVDFNFGAAPICSDPSIVLLMMENKEMTPANWAFLFPTDQQLDLEYWAETGEFNPTELHEMRIEDNQLFAVEPKSGCLLPGQRATIQLTYRHEFTGTDRIPVLLKLSHGREILLNFIGITVPKDHCYIHFLVTHHKFAPVCISTFNPPKQIYELYNGGSVRVIYDIQLDSVKSVLEKNYNHPIFQCLNPRGEIQPGMTAYIEWIFSPLEARSYSVNVPIHILDGDSALVTFTGIGYDKRVLGSCASFNDPSSYFGAPAVQQALVRGQLMFMSEERISFGNVPVFTKSSRMIFLYNISETEVIYYSWHSTSVHVSRVLSASPVSGVLHPGDSTHCIVTLRSHKNPCFYDLDLICEVYSKRQVTQYQKELQDWEKENDRQQVEFTITEWDLLDNQQPSFQRQCCCGFQGSGRRKTQRDAGTKIMKYKTLPPIKEPTETWEGQHEAKPSPGIWSRPTPAKPFLLHLGVTARSHSMEEYHKNFPSDVPKHYIMRNVISEPLSAISLPGSSGKTWGKWKNSSADSLRSASKEGMRLVTDILTTVLRCLQEDIHFQRVLVEGTAEPIPYYRQFWSEEGEELAMKSSELANTKTKDAAQEPDNIQPIEAKEEVTSTVPVTTHASRGQEPDNKPTETEGELTLTAVMNGDRGQDQELDNNQRMEAEGEETSTAPESSDDGQDQETDDTQQAEAEEEVPMNVPQSTNVSWDQEPESTQPIEVEEEVNSIVSATADINQSSDLAGTEMDEERLTEAIQESLSAIRLEEQLARRQQLKRHPEFCDLLESILENTLQNILIEASRGEVVLTSRPRVIGLPPMMSRSSLEPFSIHDISLSKEEMDHSLPIMQAVEIKSGEVSKSKIELDHASPKDLLSMAVLEKLADDLLAQPWISVSIGDSPFLLKASFSDAAYRLMLSDLDSVWWEEMNSSDLKQRAQELNKRLKAPESAFCRHLHEAVVPLLQGRGGDPLPGFTCERVRNLLNVSLRSELSGVPFYWTFRCIEAPLSMVSRHMICPLLNMMQALHRQTRDLMLLLERKDAEILDYKENGAMLSRDRLETETFNAEEFKDRFLAEG